MDQKAYGKKNTENECQVRVAKKCTNKENNKRRGKRGLYCPIRLPLAMCGYWALET